MGPLISVVITAHDRKKYLINAVKSVLNQDSNRHDFEIIVVKNFNDEAIDAFLEKEGIIRIYTDEQSFGAKLAIGIDNCKGEVISFLDDDDEFSSNKISVLIEVFKNKRITYHHSSIEAIDESGNVHSNGLSKNIPKTVVKEEFKPIDLKLVMKYKLDWYMSAISCRASVLKKRSEFIGGLSASLDKLTFLTCVESGGTIFFDSRPLTKYRVHESLTTHITDRNNFLRARKEFYLRSLNGLMQASNHFNNKACINMIKWEIVHGNLLVYFFSDDYTDKIKTSSIIRYLLISITKGLTVITFWSTMDLLRKTFPSMIRSSYYRRSMDMFQNFHS